MSLVPDYGNSTDSSSSTDTDSETENIPSKEETKLKLPAPNFDKHTTAETNEAYQNSVFLNPFIEEENAKEAVLQKHVKMVNIKDTVVINGRKICWNYRKGKCRFGHNCKYAHDSDIQKTEQQIQEEKKAALNCPNAVISKNSQSGVMSSKCFVNDDECSDEGTGAVKQKRKRPGLTQGLIPGKKVMKQYKNQKKSK
ncbi:unnamed protein product [Phyllotreta striolata]|uniref:C3H1-type domain-containing protein n=1 Tax=Phyllotreta striolata TaxID=444603 RepID=A0A9N9TWU5_PHYSR|nr:unnamed protein product [Phyllotreta striolata]